MSKYRKIPHIVDAIQVTEDLLRSKPLTETYTMHNGQNFMMFYLPDKVMVQTLEGTMVASIGDWIITGVLGEKYLCRADAFEETYVLVEEGEDD